jgi:hypothetical protein
MSEPPQNPDREPDRETPSPRVPGPWILAGLAVLVWMAQGAVTWFIIGHACPPGERQWPLGVARWVAFGVTIAALVVTVAAIVRSVGLLRGTDPLPEGEQQPAPTETMSEQRRFTAMLGLLVGAALSLGMVFAVLSTLVIRVCGETR